MPYMFISSAIFVLDAHKAPTSGLLVARTAWRASTPRAPAAHSVAPAAQYSPHLEDRFSAKGENPLIGNPEIELRRYKVRTPFDEKLLRLICL